MFGLFKKKCNHCGSKALSKEVARETGYAVPVIRTTYTCNKCGAESTKTKTYRRHEKLSDSHKNL